MATKTVCNHRYLIPPLKNLQKKFYFLITLLLFEYEENGYYRDDLEVFGFSQEESDWLCQLFPFFDQEYQALKVEEFDESILEAMISVLPEDMKNLLTDHIVLSSIDQSTDIQTLFWNMQNNFNNVGESLSREYLSQLDFQQFFVGKESTFMDKYYPSEEEKDEIRIQYSLKYN